MLFLEKYKVATGLVVLALLMAGSAAAGAIVNSWRLDGDHQRDLAEKTRRITELEASVKDQNHAADLLQAKKDAADERRQVAETFAADALRRLGGRADVVANSRATNCDGVLKEAWGAR